MKHSLLLALMLISSGLMAQVELYAPASPTTGGTTAQDFETAYDAYDAQVADDFVVPTGVTWYIDSLVIPGTYSSGANPICGLIVHFYTDNSGVPGTLVFADTFNTDIDENGDGELIARWETPVALTSGHYWMVANGRKDFSGGGQWYWLRDNGNTGYPALWRNPGNGFSTSCTGWTILYNCSALALSDSGFVFSMYGCYGPNKPLSAGFDTTLCAGEFSAITLTGVTNGSQANVQYLWNTGDTTLSIQVSTSGIYTLYAVDAVTLCGLGAEYNVNIQSVPFPEIDDDTLCGGGAMPAVFGPITGCTNCQIVWSDSSSGPFYSSDQDGWVYVTLLDTVTGCGSTDSAYLTVIPAEATIQPGALIDLCEGTTMTVSTLETLTNVLWAHSVNGVNWSAIGSNPTVDVNLAGRVAVSGINEAGCQVKDTSDLILRPSPDPEITFEAAANGNVKLTAEAGFTTYFWSNGSIGPNITVSQNGIYTVTVTNEFGCEGSTFTNVYTVGQEDIIGAQLKVYPNPANDYITLTVPGHWVGDATISVVDLQGRVLMNLNANEQVQGIDIGHLASGHYLLRIDSPEGNGKKAMVIAR